MRPIVGERRGVNLNHGLPARSNPLSEESMSDDGLVQSLDRAESALGRIERALSRLRTGGARDEHLRARVRDVVAELDSLIEEAR
jgi:hypothetical protein